jgi:hypothetical protein
MAPAQQPTLQPNKTAKTRQIACRAAGVEVVAQPELLDDAALSASLTQLRKDPLLWQQQIGVTVLTEARRRFQRLSIACGVGADDGATEAWGFWTGDLTDEQLAANYNTMWSYTGGAIRKRMGKERRAQIMLSSTKGAARAQVVGMDAPMLYEYVDDLPDSPIDPFEEVEALNGSRPESQQQAIAVVNHLLVLAGLSNLQREVAIESVSNHLSTSASLRGAAEKTTPSPLPALSQERWNAFVGLVAGTPKGSPGIVHLYSSGHPAPMTEPHIKKLLPRFLEAPVFSAAGVS